LHCPARPSARKVNQLAINPVEDLEHCEKTLHCVETLCGGLDLKQTHKRQAVVALRRCVVCLQAVACSHVIRASTIVAHGGGTGLNSFQYWSRSQVWLTFFSRLGSWPFPKKTLE